MIVNEIQTQYSGSDAMKAQIDRIVNMCKENSDIGTATRSTLDHLDSYVHLPPTVSGPELNQFFTAVTKTADQLNSRQRLLDNWIKELTKSTASILFRITNFSSALISISFESSTQTSSPS